MKFINKTIYSILVISLLITGCSTTNNMLNTNNSFDNVKSKEYYIKQASSGNLDAMIALNKYYDYPYTKEGLAAYTKWFELVKNSKDNKKLLEIAKIYSDYETMFLNGKQKRNELYKIALKNSSFDSKVAYLKQMIKVDDSLAIYNFLDQYLDSFDEKQLSTVTDVFATSQSYLKRFSLNRIFDKIKEKSYKIPASYVYYKLKNYGTPNEEKKEIYEKFLASKDVNNYVEYAKIAQKNNDRRNAIKYFRKAIELGSKDPQALYVVGKAHLRDKEKVGLEYIKESSRQGYFDASLVLIAHYSYKKEYLDEYIALKKELTKDMKAKEKLADYYSETYRKTQALKLYEELEKEGSYEALIFLALQKNRAYRYNPEEEIIRKKRVEKILESNNPILIKKFYTKMDSYEYSGNFEKELLDYKKKQAAEGNILMARELTKAYEVIDQDKLYWLKKAIKYDDINSYHTLAEDYGDNYGLVQSDDKKVMEIYNKLHERGDLRATKSLAYAYRYGQYGTSRDRQKATYYFKILEKYQDLDAYRYFATHYICGYCNEKKVPQYERAYKYVHFLANKNDSRNMTNLAWLYEEGHGVKQDYKKAFYWYKKAADLNNSTGLRNLGLLYQNGNGIKQDYKKALEYYEKAHKMGNKEATNDLGVMYENGYGVKKDYKKALFYYEKAIKKGNHYAIYNVAQLYLEGKGVKKDNKKAIEYLQRASKRDNRLALNKLGTLYYEGKIVKQDYKKALELYEKASKLGNPDSFYNLGLLYENGFGVKKDIKKAIFYYEKSKLDDANERIKKLKK